MILRRLENTFNVLQIVVYENQLLKHNIIKKTFSSQITLQNYILQKGAPTNIRIF